MNKFIKNLHDKAWSQLGTSGGGNHFVEFGIIELEERDEALNIDKGRYVALLTHSGSRGLGATIAGYYTRLAKDTTKLPKEAANLAYLDLNTQAGQEYWIAAGGFNTNPALEQPVAGRCIHSCNPVVGERDLNDRAITSGKQLHT